MADIFALFQKLSSARPQTPAGPPDCLVACLGNPGRQYENSRHNVGFLTADAAARARGFSIDRLRFQSLTGECRIAGKKALFLKPSTFMNLSGQAVAAAMSFYKIPIERVLVIHDDISLEPGRLRIRPKGSDGGHNGLKSIIQLTGSDQFPRIKIGVGAKPHPDYDLADWVLGVPGPEDRKRIEQAIAHANEALELLAAGDVAGAMNRYNG
ncbi:MAG: aminoacyl-tRNA hydrolase [Oscillospiraceae bacterium]